MVLAAERRCDDDEAPPPSGVRLRSSAITVGASPPRAPVADAGAPEVMAEVVVELCGDVWELASALAPLQGAWLTLGLPELGFAALRLARGRHATSPPVPCSTWLRRHWPTLVPGSRALDRLVGLMVDAIC
jgi:hypothetical protein